MCSEYARQVVAVKKINKNINLSFRTETSCDYFREIQDVIRLDIDLIPWFDSGVKKHRFEFFFLLKLLVEASGRHLTSETVQGAALSLQGVDDVQSSDSLSAGVFGVGNSVTDDVF